MSENNSFVREVNADLRSESVSDILKRYWWAIALIFVVILGVFAFIEYRSYQRETQAAVQYDVLDQSVNTEEITPEIANALDKNGSSASLLEEARLKKSSSDVDGARAIYENIAASDKNSTTLREFAKLQIFEIDGGTTSELANPGAPFMVEAKLIEADQLLGQGNKEEALVILEALAENVEIQAERGVIESLIISLGGNIPELETPEIDLNENADNAQGGEDVGQ